MGRASRSGGEIFTNRCTLLIAPMVLGAGCMGLTALAYMSTAKEFFNTSVMQGVTVLDAMLIIGSLVFVASASAHVYYNYKRGDQSLNSSACINTVITVSSGLAMAFIYQFSLLLISHYGADMGISSIGVTGICAAASFAVAMVYALGKNVALYREQVNDKELNTEFESFAKWIRENRGLKQVVAFDLLIPAALSIVSVGMCGMLMKNSSITFSPASMVLDSIAVSAAVVALYSAICAQLETAKYLKEEGKAI